MSSLDVLKGLLPRVLWVPWWEPSSREDRLTRATYTLLRDTFPPGPSTGRHVLATVFPTAATPAEAYLLQSDAGQQALAGWRESVVMAYRQLVEWTVSLSPDEALRIAIAESRCHCGHLWQ